MDDSDLNIVETATPTESGTGQAPASLNYSRLIDISQPVSAATACFPGDVPFSKNVTLSFAESKVINLTAFTMSPHVGSHADAPVHIKGELGNDTAAGGMSLDPFIGRIYVMDLAPHNGAIGGDVILDQLKELAIEDGIKRVLFKTRVVSKPELFEDDYSYIGADTAAKLGDLGFILTGLDTPSVDHCQSKDLAAHHALDSFGLCWLENLDLSQVEEGEYQLIALPLKLMELEASPVRAILLQ